MMPLGTQEIHDSLRFTSDQDNFVDTRMYWMANNIVALVLSDIEILNLPEKQENALKTVIKADIWRLEEEASSYFRKIHAEDSPNPPRAIPGLS